MKEWILVSNHHLPLPATYASYSTQLQQYATCSSTSELQDTLQRTRGHRGHARAPISPTMMTIGAVLALNNVFVILRVNRRLRVALVVCCDLSNFSFHVCFSLLHHLSLIHI